MNRRAYRRNTGFQKKKIILISVIAVAVVLLAVILLVTAEKQISPSSGNASFELSTKALIVRDETIENAESYEKADFLVSEGESVSFGTEIANVYAWGYSETAEKELINQQNKIIAYQRQNLASIALSQDLATINDNISKKVQQIVEALNTSSAKIMILEAELKALMDERAAFLKNNVIKDAKLEEMYQQESLLNAKIERLKRTLTAKGEGVISFYFDGADSLLTKENIPTLTANDINNIYSGKMHTSVLSSEESKPVYRLVNSNAWYLVISADKEISELAPGNEFNIEIKNHGKYKATVFDVHNDGGKYIYAFQINSGIGDLLTARTVNIVISRIYGGTMVPKKVIKTENGVQGIYIKVNAEKKFVPIMVKTISGDDCIIEPIDSTVIFNENTVIVY